MSNSQSNTHYWCSSTVGVLSGLAGCWHMCEGVLACCPRTLFVDRGVWSSLGSPLLCEMPGRSHKYACRNTGLGTESFPCSTICTCSPPCVGVRGAGMTVSLLRQQDPGTGGMPMHTGPACGPLPCTVYLLR